MEETKKVDNLLDRSISNEIWNTIHNVLQAKEVDFDYKSLGPRTIRNILNYVNELKKTLEGQKFENASDFYNILVAKFELPTVEQNQQATAINDFIELLTLEENILQGILNARNAESRILKVVSGIQKIEKANKLWSENVEIKKSNVNKDHVTFNHSLKIEIVNTQFYAEHKYEANSINPVAFDEENNKNSPIREFSEIEPTSIKAKAMSKLGGWYAIQSKFKSIWTVFKNFVNNLVNKNSVIFSAEKTVDKTISASQSASMQTYVKKTSTYSGIKSQLEANPPKSSSPLSENMVELDELNKKEVTVDLPQSTSASNPLASDHIHSDDSSEDSISHSPATRNFSQSKSSV